MSQETTCVVCDMPIDVKGSFTAEWEGKVFEFCSDSCREEFLLDPDLYAKEDEEEEPEQP